jgi:hypothetical protein
MIESNIKFSNDIILTTYPRSGSHFFHKAFLLLTGIHIDKTHDITKTKHKYIINISRDPAESIASWIIMQKHFHNLINNENYIKLVCVPRYIKFQSNIIISANFIINYLDLKLQPDIVVKDIANKTNSPLIVDSLNVNKAEKMLDEISNKNNLYLKTSSTFKEYPLILENLKKYNLDMCYDLYYKSIERSIKYD